MRRLIIRYRINRNPSEPIVNQHTARMTDRHRDRPIALREERGVRSRVCRPVPLRLREGFPYPGHREGDPTLAETASRVVDAARGFLARGHAP